jgi:hypothetical protein
MKNAPVGVSLPGRTIPQKKISAGFFNLRENKFENFIMSILKKKMRLG